MASVVGLAGVPAAGAAVAKPSVTRVSPNVGTIQGNTRVTVSGANFVRVSAVTFGGVKGTGIRVAIGGRSLSVTAPRHAAGTVDVRVTAAAGSSALSTHDRFVYAGTPTITSVSRPSLEYPANLPAGGDSITIKGSNYYNVRSVTFGGVKGTGVAVLGPTSLRVTTPPHAPGMVPVVVTTAFGTATRADAYRYLGNWSGATTVGAGSVDALSCGPANGTCAATGSGRDVHTRVGGNWSTQTDVIPADSTATFSDTSCASDGFCMAVTTDGTYSTRSKDGGDWSAPLQIGEGDEAATFLQRVSCVSDTFCVALGYDSAYTWRGAGTSWVTSSLLPDLRGVSCYADNACVVTGDKAWWRTNVDGVFGTAPTGTLPDMGQRGGVSCTTSGYCALVDPNRVFVLASSSSSSWVSGTLSTSDDLIGVSCFGQSAFCIAITYGSDVYLRFGGPGPWYHGSVDPEGMVPQRAVSCYAPEQCTVGTDEGNAHEYTDVP